MKKSVAIAIGIGIFVGLVGFGTYFVTRKPKEITEVQPVQTQVKLLDWKDPNGFSFQYPEGVTIDKHDEDKVNYAHIEMTHASFPGNLIVWGKDTTANDVSAWVNTEKLFQNASILDTTLGEIPAKKILLKTNNIIIGTIYDEILWYIEVEPSDDYWQKTFDTIIQSFTFVSLPSESAPGEEEMSVDEEEVIE